MRVWVAQLQVLELTMITLKSSNQVVPLTSMLVLVFISWANNWVLVFIQGNKRTKLVICILLEHL